MAEPAPPKIVKKKRRVVAYEARPKKHKRGQLAAHKHGRKHKYVIVESANPKRIVYAYRQKPHAAPPVPVRNKRLRVPARLSRARAEAASRPQPRRAPRLRGPTPCVALAAAMTRISSARTRRTTATAGSRTLFSSVRVSISR